MNVLIEEIWIVYETKSIYSKSYTENSFLLNSQLFSGFISALLILSEEVTGSSANIRNIELINTRLSIIKQNIFDTEKDFVLIGRSSSNIPPERVFQQLQVLSKEIKFLLENNLSSSIKENPLNIIDLKAVQGVMEESLDPQLIQWSEMTKQIATVDQITFMNLINNIFSLIQEIYPISDQKIVELFNNSPHENTGQILDLIINKDENKFDNGTKQEISQEIEQIIEITHEILIDFSSILQNMTITCSKENAQLKLLKFITKNWNLIKHFQLEDIFMQEISPNIMKEN
jgi:uncharacterized pyridoxamine 5'-phosphate oxidase family protein